MKGGAVGWGGLGALRAIFAGLGRAAGTPRLVLFLWLANLLVALPAAVAIGDSIHRSIGASQVHETLREGFDLAWHGEYAQAARGIERTFSPSVLGIGTVFDNLEAWLFGGLFTGEPTIVALGVLWGLLWMFFAGGILDLCARPGAPFVAGRFLNTGGNYFFRFLRLGAISAALYWGVYRLGRWLFLRVGEATRDITSEGRVLLWYVAAAVAVVLLLALVRTIGDYAKVAIVVERRQSAVVAFIRGLVFVATRPFRALAVYGGLALAGVAVLALYWLVAPGAGGAGWASVGLALLAGQALVAAKLALRVALYGAELALFRGLSRDTLPPPL